MQCRRVGRESEFLVVLAPKSFTGRDLTSRLTWWDHPTVRKQHLSWPEDVDDSVTALIAPIHAAARAGEKLTATGASRTWVTGKPPDGAQDGLRRLGCAHNV